MPRIASILLVGLALAAGSACARAQARTPAAIPVLDTPAPPPRLVIPVAVEPPPAPPPATPERPPAAAPARPRETPPRTTPPPTPPVTETVPPPVLQTVPSLAELEARAKDRLDRAEKDLARVSRASLGRDARDQYDSAARFIRMAKDAMGAKNFVYAAYCADKAAALAGLLVKMPPSSDADVRARTST